MSEFRFSKRIEVRFRDCDPMGHVNNAVYLTYLEVARFAYWRHVFAGHDAGGLQFILARMECDFRAQAAMGEELDVHVRVSRLGRSSFDFDAEIVRVADDVRILESRAVMVVYDYAAQTPVPIPEAARRRIEEFEGDGRG
ncbi:MAG: thioesterase family protein [Vicinamibacterales bacterium]|nr:thioesterase family protein [Vicinamibacterales bacterium]